MSPNSPGRILAPFAAAAFAILALALTAPRAHAQVWAEAGDAGQTPANAQITVGSGPLTEIDGNLDSNLDVDMYCIHVTDVAGFVASLQCVAIQGPHLWLFDASGKGVAMNSICQASSKFVNGAFLSGTGTYYVAVGYDGQWPYAGADLIWLQAYVGQRAPDGPGAANPLSSWQGVGNPQPINPYKISLVGATFCESPTPAANGTWGGVKAIYR